MEATLPFGSYHQIIVNGSFDNVTRVDEVYHHGGRGFPDVAAVGENQIVLWAGQWWTIGGTSLSAPLWGSMLTLINEPDERTTVTPCRPSFMYSLHWRYW